MHWASRMDHVVIVAVKTVNATISFDTLKNNPKEQNHITNGPKRCSPVPVYYKY